MNESAEGRLTGRFPKNESAEKAGRFPKHKSVKMGSGKDSERTECTGGRMGISRKERKERKE